MIFENIFATHFLPATKQAVDKRLIQGAICNALTTPVTYFSISVTALRFCTHFWKKSEISHWSLTCYVLLSLLRVYFFCLYLCETWPTSKHCSTGVSRPFANMGICSTKNWKHVFLFLFCFVFNASMHNVFPWMWKLTDRSKCRRRREILKRVNITCVNELYVYRPILPPPVHPSPPPPVLHSAV